MFQFRNWSYRVFLSSPAKHGERVAAIQRQVGKMLFSHLCRECRELAMSWQCRGNVVAMLMLANMCPLLRQCPLMAPLSPEESQHDTIVAAGHIIAKDTAT